MPATPTKPTLRRAPAAANRRKAKKIIANLAAAETTQLEVSVGTGEADIFLDAKSLGVFCVADPTCVKGLLPGRYKVIALRKGFVSAQMEVQLRLGKTTPAVFALVENPSATTITVVPADAVVTVDGKPAKTGEPITLESGEHKVTATLEGFAEVRQTVIASRGEPLAVELALGERIAINTNVDGATVSLDGTAIEPFDGIAIVPTDGKPHTISMTAKDHQPAEVVIPADRERGQPITLNLERVPVEVVTQPPAPQASGWTTQRKTLFGALLGVGAVGVGLGTYTGLSARNNWNDTDSECDNQGFCSPRGLELRDDAIGNATASNISFGIAAAALFGAAAVYLTVPKVTDTGPTASAIITDSEVGLSVTMGF